VRIVISGASGLIGQELLRHLRAGGHEVVTLVRRPVRSAAEVRWDPDAGSLDPTALGHVDAAVNLSGAGVGDQRWTEEYRRLILSSRVRTTSTLVDALRRLDSPPQVLLNAYAIGVYGDAGETVLTEDSPAGEGFLADVVQQWEQAAAPAAEAGTRVATLRTGLLANPQGGAFGRLLTLFRAGVGGPLGSGKQWWSLISMPDEVAAVEFLLTHPVHGPVNLTCPEPARNVDVSKTLGRALHRPALLKVPSVALRIALGDFSAEILASQRVVPAKLLAAGFTFRHPDAGAVLRWLADA